MDDLDIPLPPPSLIPLPSDNEPKLVITSRTDGERSVSAVTDEPDLDESKSHKAKKKHKKEKHKHKHKHKSKDKDKKKQPLITPEVLSQHATAIKAAMLKEVQAESNADNALSQSIVDDLFKDFLAAKMNEIESAYKKTAEEQTDSGYVVNSVEEMNKLLDAELDNISQNTPSPIKKSSKSEKSEKLSKRDSSSSKSSVKSAKSDSKSENTSSKSSQSVSSSKQISSKVLVPSVADIVLPKEAPPRKSVISDIDLPKEAPPPSKSVISVVSTVAKPSSSQTLSKQDSIDSVASNSSITLENKTEKDSVKIDESKVEGPSFEQPKIPLEIKKPGKLQFAFKISQTSAELISKGLTAEDTVEIKKKKNLEEGEVLSSGHNSSSDSESEKDEGEEGDDGDVSETGSLSDSDKDTKDKSKKKKKKKKHKKKKKKHKTSKEKDKENEGTENKNKRKRSSKSRSRSPKKSRKSRSTSKDRRKRSRSKSFSPGHGVWRESKSKEKRCRSFSPEHGVWRSSRHKHRSRSREKDRDSKRHDHDRHKDRDYDHRDKHKHDRDYDRDRRRSREREDKKDSERRYGKWRSRSRSRERHRDKGKDSEDLRLKIDKAKLREIAMKNALAMAKSGQGPAMGVDFAAIKAGGKSIDELTEFCARIAAKEKLKKNRPEGLTSSSSSENSDEESLIHHPFKVVEKSITMNIKNATTLPIMTPQEKITQQATLRLTFPVSSGNVHRTKEIEWVPVEKSETVSTSIVSNTTTTVAISTPSGAIETNKAVVPTVATEVKLMPVREEDKVFSETPAIEPPPVDISKIIAERIKAARKLAENPTDMGAMSAMQKAQRNASLWASSKNLPGKFTGSTGAKILSQDELMCPDKRRQAWAKKTISEVTRYRKYRRKFSTDVVRKLVLKSLAIVEMKDQFNRAAPVKSGIGMALLQKMGWQQGTGLGKNNEGGLEPLALDFKMDRKGLSSHDEGKANQKKVNVTRAAMPKDLSGKHPVSALVELCNRRRWGTPDFQLVHEGGPDHKKSFLFKVVVNGVEYSPSTASLNKKTAKAAAATAVLQEMGLVPRG